jgi:hypothetical protein
VGQEGLVCDHLQAGEHCVNAGQVDDLMDALGRAAVDLPEPTAPAPHAVQMLVLVPGAGGAGLHTGSLMRDLGVVDGRLPEKQATIHRLLNAVSGRTREALLVRFVCQPFSAGVFTDLGNGTVGDSQTSCGRESCRPSIGTR